MEWFSKKELNKGELTFKIDLDKIKEGLDKAFDKNKKNIKSCYTSDKYK